MRKTLIKIKSWEFWPISVVYFPIIFSWLWSSIKQKSFFFFTTVNPKIEMGGFVGESKMGILNQIPNQYIPNTIFVVSTEKFETVKSDLIVNNIKFPCIAKPDIGERGLGVQICKNLQELEKYKKQANYNFIIQDFIDYPIELAILYYRFPNEIKGTISSVCEKEFLSIVGNGKDNVRTIIKKDDRAFLQLERLEENNSDLLNKTLKKEEKLVLEYIGNHNRGTIFLDKREYITIELTKAFDKLSLQIPELYFGRYDLKCKSIEDLIKLKNFSIIEINGVSAEPAHIYQPGYSFIQAQRDLLQQWKILYKISKTQISKGIKPMTFLCAIKHIKAYRKKIFLHSN